MEKIIKIIRASTFILICILWIGVLSEIMKTKLMDGFSDVTRKVHGFYAEEENSLDFIFLGSSRVYSAVNPAVLWDKYGITSYDFCCNEQSYSITYFYLKEALKKQKPKAVVVDVSFGVAMTETREPMRHLNFAFLRPSLNKIEAVNANAEGMEKFEYLFPIRKWHSSWYNLQEENFEYSFWYDNNPYKGFSYLESVETVSLPTYDYPYNMEENVKLYYTEPLAENLEWVNKMIDYTRQQGVDLILITVPDGSAPEGQGYYNGIFRHVKDEEGVICKNYNLEMSGMHHLTAELAEAFTEKLGEDLSKWYEINDKRGNPKYQQWEETVQVYEAEMEAIDIRRQTDWRSYIKNVSIGDYDLFVLQTPWTCDADKWQVIRDNMQLVGINLPGDSQSNYMAVVNDKNMEMWVTEVNEDSNIERRREDIYYKIDSSGITINKQIYPGINGLRLVVYDKLLQRVVDSIYINDNNLELKR